MTTLSQPSLVSRGQNSTFAATLLGVGDPSLELRDGGRHFGVARVSDTPAVDFDRAQPPETRG